MLPISGFSEMSSAQLFDKRRNKGGAQLIDSLVGQHNGSFSFTVGDACRQVAHRLFASKKVTPDAMISGHIVAALDRARMACKPEDPLLIMQDTTDFDYTNHRKTTGLGSIGKGCSMGKGLQSHGALAVSPDGLPLGIMDIEIWARDFPDKSLTKEDKHKINKTKSVDQKESKKWLECFKQVQANTPETLKLLFIQDREADLFELFEAPRRSGTDLLVRAAQPRLVEIVSEYPQGASVSNVFTAVRSATSLGQINVQVSAKGEHKERTAILDVRVCQVLLKAPKDRLASQNRTPKEVWLISAREANPPEGGAQLDWTLISTLSASTFEEACRLLNFYALRWLIERLHFVLKSGLHAESLRFDDADSLKNALSLLYIVAWRLLHLTYLARKNPEEPAVASLKAREIEVLSLIEGKTVQTISSAVIAIAKLGGYKATPKAGPPGVKALWVGLRRLDAMIAGYLLAMAQLQKDVNHC